MVNTEKRGPIGALRARSEKRTHEAEYLAMSNPVYVLKKEVRLRHPDAKITVTKPRVNPFARVKIRAEWNITYKDSLVGTSAGNVNMTMTFGNRLELTVSKNGQDGDHGVIIKSGNGEKLIPNQADPDEVTDKVTAAVDNPLPIDRLYIPLREAIIKRSRRAI